MPYICHSTSTTCLVHPHASQETTFPSRPLPNTAHLVASQVADLGCGAGAVISLLTLPAEYLDDFPELYPSDPVVRSPSSPSASSPEAVHRLAKLDTLRSVPRRPPHQQQLHLRRLIGVDVDRASVERASVVTQPPRPDAGADAERWEELKVDLYEGGAEVYNSALERTEAMIATEVSFRATAAALIGPWLMSDRAGY